MNDWSLLRDYVERRSESAFDALVRRHLDMVYAAALRQVGDAHLAEDVTQAVFVLLARKAPRLRAGVIVAGWLYRTACLVAKRARRDQTRRQLKEKQAADMNLTDSTDEVWETLAPHVDSAMADLGEMDRNAIVLRFLQQRSFREVASALGVSEDAAKKRVTRALEKLRGILGRRGIPVGAAALAPALSAKALQTAPSGLCASSVQAGISAGATASVAVGGLVAGALREALIMRLKWGAALTGALALLIAGWFELRTGPSAETGNMNATTISGNDEALVAQPIITPVETSEQAAIPKNAPAMALHVVRAEDDLPLANAEVRAEFHGPKFERADFTTDSDGVADVTRPARPFAGMTLWVAASARVPKAIRWDRAEEPSLPSDYTVRLVEGRRLEGFVVDEEQRPVVGAKLKFQGQGDDWRSREFVNYGTRLTTPVTDTAGHWVADFMPPNTKWLAGQIQHPDFADTRFGRDIELNAPTNLVLVVQRGSLVTGTIRDAEAQPIGQARLHLQDVSGWRDSRDAQTDAAGDFEFPRVAQGQFRLAASAEGFRSADRLLKLSGSGTNADFTLSRAPVAGNAVLRGRVVDEEGQPARGVNVSLDHGQVGLEEVAWIESVDDAGKFEWRHAPDRAVKLSFGGWDWETQVVELAPDGTEHTITVRSKPTLLLNGTVIDKTTGAPVPSFKVIFGFAPHENEFFRQPEFLGEGRDGRFAFRLQSTRLEDGYHQGGPRLMIEADGYANQIVALAKQTNNIELNITLEPGGEIEGTALLPNGQPAVGAEVSCRGKRQGVLMKKPGEFYESSYPGQVKARTSEDGTFRIRLIAGAERLAVTHEEGWANAPLATFSAYPVRLQAWGKIEGVVRVGGKTWPGIELSATSGNRGVEQVLFGFETKADEEGHFEFAKVPGGVAQVSVKIHGDRMSVGSHSQLVSVRSGQTTTITVGGSGARIIGRVETRPDRADINWQQSPLFLQPKGPPSEELGNRDYAFFCGDAGSFVVEDVPPGEYRLNVNLEGREDRVDAAGNVFKEHLGGELRDVTIPATLATGGELDLGVIQIKVKAQE